MSAGLSQLSLGKGEAAGQGQGRSSAAAPADVVRRDLQYTQCLAEHLLRAVWLYASSGNVAFLLMVQRHLLKLQNNDGDRCETRNLDLDFVELCIVFTNRILLLHTDLDLIAKYARLTL